MTESDIDKEVEKMLSLDDDEDTRVAILQSQVSVLIEQVKKLSQQAAQSEQPMELDRPATAVALNFRNVMQRVREGDAIPPVELSPFNPADAEQAIGLQTGAAHDHTSDAEQPRVDIGSPQEDPLHLFHPCTCNIFRTKAQTALPSLRSDLARSKPVNNMFELANVASIVLDPFWGDRRKEEELLAKDSKHLTVLGLAHAIAAHRSSCYAFSSALRNARGKRIIHPPLFPAFPGYHIQSYYNQAIERMDQIPKEYDDSPANPTIVALPLSFLRAEKELEENDKVKVMVYSTLDGLASQLNEQTISAAIVLVWPDSMPSTLHLNHVMHALERHLQCGGTLDMYPPPYEERRSEVWHSVKKVCAEVAEVLTGPARGFDARVVDAYGTIDETVPLGHPATSLGVSPRRGDDKFHPWQVAVYLNQVRKFAMNTLSLPIFFAVKKKKDVANVKEALHHSTEDQPPKKKAKMMKPQVMYLRDAKTERRRYAHAMKQKGRHYK